MRGMCNARSGRIGLREDTGAIRKSVSDGRKLFQNAAQASFELLICLYQLILSKVLVRQF